LHFTGVGENRTAPPGLERQDLSFSVSTFIDVVSLVQKVLAVRELEIRDEVGPSSLPAPGLDAVSHVPRTPPR
jgi:hypothetical protein